MLDSSHVAMVFMFGFHVAVLHVAIESCLIYMLLFGFHALELFVFGDGACMWLVRGSCLHAMVFMCWGNYVETQKVDAWHERWQVERQPVAGGGGGGDNKDKWFSTCRSQKYKNDCQHVETQKYKLIPKCRNQER